MKKVLVLGCTGMLGGMVSEYLLRQDDIDLIPAARTPDKWFSGLKKTLPVFIDAESESSLTDILKEHNPEFIINCIGITKPYCKDDDIKERLRAICINSRFPYLLQKEVSKHNAKVINIATDCVYSGQRGKYVESSTHDALDVYGKTKSLGEVSAKNFLNIRCSIIGPERYNKVFLFEWFLALSEGSDAKGFAHHLWNGISTLQFAELCYDIISERRGLTFDSVVAESSIHHFVPNETVNKFELLNIFSKVYGKDINITRVDDIGPPVDRTLSSNYGLLMKEKTLKSMESAMTDLYNFIKKTNFYSR